MSLKVLSVLIAAGSALAIHSSQAAVVGPWGASLSPTGYGCPSRIDGANSIGGVAITYVYNATLVEGSEDACNYLGKVTGYDHKYGGHPVPVMDNYPMNFRRGDADLTLISKDLADASRVKAEVEKGIPFVSTTDEGQLTLFPRKYVVYTGQTTVAQYGQVLINYGHRLGVPVISMPAGWSCVGYAGPYSHKSHELTCTDTQHIGYSFAFKPKEAVEGKVRDAVMEHRAMIEERVQHGNNHEMSRGYPNLRR